GAGVPRLRPALAARRRALADLRPRRARRRRPRRGRLRAQRVAARHLAEQRHAAELHLPPGRVRPAAAHPRLPDVHLHPAVPDRPPGARGPAAMSTSLSPATDRSTSYGERRLSLVDRFGVWLSRRAIQKRLPARTDLAALDLGSGYHATLLRSLLPSLARGVAVDVKLSPELLATPRMTGIESTVEDALPGLADARFDLILLINVLEHLWEPLDVLRHCRRVLRPGGVLFVNVPTWRGKFFLELSAFRLGT